MSRGPGAAGRHALPRQPHVTLEVSLEAFTPHYGPTTGQHERNEEEDIDTAPLYYTFPCRCSSEFVITTKNLEDAVEVVGCTGCGEWVRVLYEVVED
ncbi:hypothetical protein BD324DRAFT_633874 [Kockovaella imperatae]|uniref:DPH-type MB domain-containing protein n=1 Tax=Kockovaella imperatae TaxID=4999 RepID=A0A1Y1UDE0_9TREE|nr:hypothetical protein BD324DRAFT_633874 [Kockovaella imperatae]ORX35095.1 hypothetical protein BD324DRAFT_633874 [Kockovaella imperatae]